MSPNRLHANTHVSADSSGVRGAPFPCGNVLPILSIVMEQEKTARTQPWAPVPCEFSAGVPSCFPCADAPWDGIRGSSPGTAAKAVQPILHCRMGLALSVPPCRTRSPRGDSDHRDLADHGVRRAVKGTVECPPVFCHPRLNMQFAEAVPPSAPRLRVIIKSEGPHQPWVGANPPSRELPWKTPRTHRLRATSALCSIIRQTQEPTPPPARRNPPAMGPAR